MSNVRDLIAAFASSVEAGARLLKAEPALLHATTERRGETALHWLAVENRLDAVRFLLSRGAAVDAAASANDTPLMSAARLGLEEMCALLIGAGANVHAMDENEESVLHHAARSGKSNVVRLLIRAGADAHVVNGFGQTAEEVAPPRLREQVLAALGES